MPSSIHYPRLSCNQFPPSPSPPSQLSQPRTDYILKPCNQALSDLVVQERSGRVFLSDQDLLTHDKQKELNNILRDIEAGPDAGKPMAISNLSGVQIRGMFHLGMDKNIDVSTIGYLSNAAVDVVYATCLATKSSQRRPLEPSSRTAGRSQFQLLHVHRSGSVLTLVLMQSRTPLLLLWKISKMNYRGIRTMSVLGRGSFAARFRILILVVENLYNWTLVSTRRSTSRSIQI
jgi:hypothetical protein